MFAHELNYDGFVSKNHSLVFAQVMVEKDGFFRYKHEYIIMDSFGEK